MFVSENFIFLDCNEIQRQYLGMNKSIQLTKSWSLYNSGKNKNSK